eukprot:TRINITY_DN28856_c0_g2_i1.p1 TRINITY_DN28856_c0_g2~~TRINITY_DN28856_c0_g2_i1.p1  ORF type:complete len:512 (+),score=47.41 TRINITY_DN28856_c0_g2_i1:176-1711(+)
MLSIFSWQSRGSSDRRSPALTIAFLLHICRGGWASEISPSKAIKGCFRVVHIPPRYFFTPGRIFNAAETLLQNGTSSAWKREAPHVQLLVELTYSTYIEEVFKSCPPLLMTVYILAGGLDDALTTWLHGLRSKKASMLAAVARSVQLSHIRFLRAASDDRRDKSTMWQAALEKKWPSLNRLPGVLIKAVGCEPAGRLDLTLSALTAGLPYDSSGLGCPVDAVTFSPKTFFQSAGVAPTKTHFFLEMMPYLAARPTAFGCEHDHQILMSTLQHHVSDASLLRGLVLEFGTGCQASSANIIAQHLQAVQRRSGTTGPAPRIFSFDSFRGLPRDWGSLRKGTYSVTDQVCISAMTEDAVNSDDGRVRPVTVNGHLGPAVEPNVEFVVGYFNESLRPFLQGVRVGAGAAGQGTSPVVALAHIDADLYESTTLILEELSPFLAEGSVLVFDDLFVDVAGVTGAKENWDAVFEALQMSLQRWRLEVLVAPWHLNILAQPHANIRTGGRDSCAFRLLA